MAAVALDASLWDEPTTGIALYTRQLASALAARGVEVERWGARRSGEAPRGRWSRSTWTVAQLPQVLAARKPRLFHAVSNFNLPLVPVDGVPYVLTLHDLVPLLLPDTVSTAFRWQFRAWLARSLQVAREVICVSETARDSVLARFDVSPEKLTVIHHGVDHVDALLQDDPVTEAWIDALGLSSPWVLYAGALDARKNVELVLDAVSRLHEGGRRVSLVLAGQRWFGAGPIEQRVQAMKARGVDVRPLGYLDERVFYAVMRRAGVFVFPSRYEGFGLPPLEAMHLGVPTIVSSAGSLPEVCGDGALAVDPDDAAGLAAHLELLLGDALQRADWARRARLRAAHFRWQRTAEQTAAVYERVAPAPPRAR